MLKYNSTSSIPRLCGHFVCLLCCVSLFVFVSSSLYVIYSYPDTRSMVAQWLLGNTGTNMADDEKEQELSTNLSTNHDTAWKQKYFTLLKHCRQIEQVM